MNLLRGRVEAILRGQPSAGSWAIVLGCGLVYGGVMGLFGGRWGQVAYSAVKVPLLLAATLTLSLPTYFVLNTLLGLRDDFATAWRAVVASQAGLTIILVALAPLTAFWYSSFAAYRPAILFNTLMFGVASLGAQVILRRSYQPLIARDRKHQSLLRTWIFLYAFCRDPDGLEPPAVRRQPRRTGWVLPGGCLGECLCGRRADFVGGRDGPPLSSVTGDGRLGGRGPAPGRRWSSWVSRAHRTG